MEVLATQVYPKLKSYYTPIPFYQANIMHTYPLYVVTVTVVLCKC